MIPEFSAAYRSLLGQLGEADVDTEQVYHSLDALRAAIGRATDLLEAEAPAD